MSEPQAPASAAPHRQVARCPQCELRQYLRANCRRCGQALTEVSVIALTAEQQPVVVEKIVERVVVVEKRPTHSLPEGVVFGERLPTMRELKEALIREAVFRCGGNGPEAAKMIGMGKTTMYRHKLDKVQPRITDGPLIPPCVEMRGFAPEDLMSDETLDGVRVEGLAE